ncbi:DnaJ domain-containing protein [Rhodocytophaga rosea]|uniref:DnaJ domain-containing protein n=1 Tax=Rhodocytophaga rosea TaxID=2704465 RepID=A0A6C0GQ31_9BACT|nr:DnaJ domain-containing protein [Rhodocytophaga rosea]QHT70161.1 DnaJ domain-containing protein [Rhodocytophaga rosea]
MLFEKLVRIIRANMLSKEGKLPPVDQQYQQYTSSRQQAGQKKQTPPPTDISSKEKSYYEALEITPPTSFEQIKTAYKKLVRKYHPDLFANNPQKRQYAEIVTQKINEAYAYFEKKAGK